MRKFLLLLTALAAVAVPSLAVTAPANADAGSPTCITKAEWRKVHQGMSRARVQQITGVWGHITSSADYANGTRDIDVDYRQCRANGTRASSWDTTWMSYQNYHYNSDYDEVLNAGRVMRVDYKGAWFSVN